VQADSVFPGEVPEPGLPSRPTAKWLRLAKPRATLDTAAHLALREGPAPTGACHTTAMNKPRVLLVDDDRSVLDALSTSWAVTGFQIGISIFRHFASHKTPEILAP
jgi:hypothetical protein